MDRRRPDFSLREIPRSNRSLHRVHPSHCWPRSAPSQHQRVHVGAGKDRPLLQRPGRGSVRRAVVPMFSSAAISIGLPFADYLPTVDGRVDLMPRIGCRIASDLSNPSPIGSSGAFRLVPQFELGLGAEYQIRAYESDASFRARSHWPYPGLKAWAILFSNFVANAAASHRSICHDPVRQTPNATLGTPCALSHST
jgi:hypothetical protein